MISIILKRTKKGVRAMKVEWDRGFVGGFGVKRPMKLSLAESLIMDGKAELIDESIVQKAPNFHY